MILGPISFLDCLVFVLFLLPQLLLGINLLELIKVGLQVLPHLSEQPGASSPKHSTLISTSHLDPFVIRP